MGTLANLQLEYKIALQDKAGEIERITDSTNVRDSSIAQAVSFYTRRIPRVRTILVSTQASKFYPLPSDWQPWSRIVSLEYPLDTSPPSYIALRSIRFQRRETAQYYHPQTTNPVSSHRLTYTAPHGVVTGGGSNVYESIDATHEPLIGKWAASIAADIFASHFGQTYENNLDAINYRTKADEWRAIAKNLREEVEREINGAEYAQLFATTPDKTDDKTWQR